MATPTSAATTLHLGSRFATELPEMAIPWQADEVPEPTLIALNTRLAADLGLDPDWLRSPAGIRMLLGQDLPEATTPVAQAYTGHQFGMLAPRLGDGRALLLGELTAPDGTLHDVHLKGSGRTPFSRGGDGLAPLGPMLREFIVSESMHALGIPSTGSLAVLGTGRPVLREDGYHPGAILVRTAASHLRVGSLEYARGLPDSTVLRRVADHAISRHHPEAADAEHPYRELLARVSAVQARLVAQWMSIGFVHGVMNTDNMTLSGEGIDYGPCAFLDGFDPQAVFSSIDTGGRYAYGRQPGIAHWNLSRLAEAMLPLLHEETDAAVDMAHEVLDTFPRDFGQAWTAGMRAKRGLGEEHDDQVVGPLANELLVLLSAGRTDHTSFFRHLGEHIENTTHDAGPVTAGAPPTGGAPLAPVGSAADGRHLADTVADPEALTAWLDRWRALDPDPEPMARSNPAYIPRNHRVDEALTAAETGDLEPFHALLDALRDPYRERAGRERFAGPPPEGTGPTVTFCGT